MYSCGPFSGRSLERRPRHDRSGDGRGPNPAHQHDTHEDPRDETRIVADHPEPEGVLLDVAPTTRVPFCSGCSRLRPQPRGFLIERIWRLTFPVRASTVSK